jgi:hypothetical protein
LINPSMEWILILHSAHQMKMGPPPMEEIMRRVPMDRRVFAHVEDHRDPKIVAR